MVHYNHSLSVDATIMVSKNCPVIGEFRDTIDIGGGVGRGTGKGGGFELRSSFQFKCPTPGKLTLVKIVQIPHPRDSSVVQKNTNSPSLSRKRYRSVKKRIKHQKVVNKRLQSNNFKMQRLFNIEMSPNLY